MCEQTLERTVEKAKEPASKISCLAQEGKNMQLSTHRCTLFSHNAWLAKWKEFLRAVLFPVNTCFLT